MLLERTNPRMHRRLGTGGETLNDSSSKSETVAMSKSNRLHHPERIEGDQCSSSASKRARFRLDFSVIEASERGVWSKLWSGRVILFSSSSRETCGIVVVFRFMADVCAVVVAAQDDGETNVLKVNLCKKGVEYSKSGLVGGLESLFS
jgi:hypothetical protein